MKGRKPPRVKVNWKRGRRMAVCAPTDKNHSVKVRVLPTTPVGCGGINGFHGPLVDAPLSNRGGSEVCMPFASVGSSPTIHTIFRLKLKLRVKE